LTLSIKKGEIFGLLGPNGAGKTSLINAITGVFKPTMGNIWVAGTNAITEMEEMQLKIGVCPQFDILWNDLTVKDHLLFYARLKGISTKLIEQTI